MFKKVLFLVLFVFGCGVSPKEAAKSLDDSLVHPDSWCKYEAEEPSEVDKSFNHPDGYGITSTFGCFDSASTWPGGYCYVPSSKSQRVRLFQDGQLYTWYTHQVSTFLEVQSRMNDLDWTVDQWSTGQPTPTIELHTGSTESNGYLGGADMLEVSTVLDDQGTWRFFHKCKATLYKTSIEANQFYQAASSTNKIKYLRNLWDHEISHCFGLPHTQNTSDTLMSITYFSNGPYFTSDLDPTQSELDMLEGYDPG